MRSWDMAGAGPVSRRRRSQTRSLASHSAVGPAGFGAAPERCTASPSRVDVLRSTSPDRQYRTAPHSPDILLPNVNLTDATPNTDATPYIQRGVCCFKSPTHTMPRTSSSRSPGSSMHGKSPTPAALKLSSHYENTEPGHDRGGTVVLEDHLHMACYHPHATRETTHQQLGYGPAGLYLLRKSRDHGSLSLSLVGITEVMHFLITQGQEGLWQLMGKAPTFASVCDLLDFYHSVPPSTTDGTCCCYPYTGTSVPLQPLSPPVPARRHTLMNDLGPPSGARVRGRAGGDSAGVPSESITHYARLSSDVALDTHTMQLVRRMSEVRSDRMSFSQSRSSSRSRLSSASANSTGSDMHTSRRGSTGSTGSGGEQGPLRRKRVSHTSYRTCLL